ncbi:hypothetical protein WA026_012272 [Henosepilachna vigintioctopunctata]|uniref:Cytochrome P450 n=1 Tax=Henosepilachna vigintioctopunctata TaxID=420089 RepID=A0AAW1V730_9CUCU
MLGVVLCFIFGAFLLVKIFQSKGSRILKQVPGPPEFPILGNIPEVFYKTPGELFTTIRKHSMKYPIYRLSLGPSHTINIVNPGDVEQILSSYKHMSKSKLYTYFTSWLGTGLLTSTGEIWHYRRKLLTPVFHFKILQEYYVVFKENTEKIIERIEEECLENNVMDIKPVITEFTLQSIAETALSMKNLDYSVLNTYKNNVLEMGKVVIDRVTRPWCDLDFIYHFTQFSKREKSVVKKLHHFSNTVIKSKKEEKIKDDRLNGGLLDVLLKAKKQGACLDDEDIREEVDTFMFEGHDTTTAAISLILMLLANNPEVQEKAAEEIANVIDSESEISFSDMQKLPYLERCIRESLRLYPSVPMISRSAGCDFVTTSGYKIPEGTTLHIHIYDLHRKPDIYPDPLAFDPDRFLRENCVGRHPYAYLPFSAGPRNCIGQKFAMLELKIFLVGVLRKFKMEAVTKQEEVELESDFVLKTSGPIKIRFITRNNN